MMGIFSSSNAKQGRSKPDFSNVSSGSSSSAPSPVGGAPADTYSETYTVREGDTLSKIARARYGKASEWPRVYEANRDIIKDPDLIYPGQTLTIPHA
jgi:nucleoid-associated protein YgaU